MLTIGELAERVGVRTSTLRYYEKVGLLLPDGRSDAGYRLYYPRAEHRLRLIQRAQRLGFSLADIDTLLSGWDTGDLSDEALIATAENRYLALERRVTELMVVQHELELFLQDLHKRESQGGPTPFDELLEHVCADPVATPTSITMLDWLRRYSGCVLTTDKAQALLDSLRGQHVHVWQEDESYHILIVSHDPEVGQALQELAQLEANCQAHTHPMPELTYGDEGYLFVARGDNAFIFARLFLALEQEGQA
jgi:DNA-binding transcriptional MerR regulator